MAINYRIRWKEKGQSSYINQGGSTGIYLPGTSLGITAMSHSGSTVTVTTASNNNFAIGQGVMISGVTTGTFNGLVEVTSSSGTSFTYAAATSPGTFSSTTSPNALATPTQKVESTISSISGASGVVTVTTAQAHGLLVGEPVRITGVSVTGYNATTTVRSVPSTTIFTYSNTTTTSGATGGTVISQGVFTIRTENCANPNTITSGKSYDIEVTYDSGGTLAWSGSAVTATPMSATVDTSTFTPTALTGTNATVTSGTDGSATRVSFSNGSGTLLYGIQVDFLQSWNAWVDCTCTVTYMGRTYSIVATKGAKSGGKAFFPVPLGAGVTITANKNNGSLSGSIVMVPYNA